MLIEPDQSESGYACVINDFYSVPYAKRYIHVIKANSNGLWRAAANSEKPCTITEYGEEYNGEVEIRTGIENYSGQYAGSDTDTMSFDINFYSGMITAVIETGVLDGPGRFTPLKITINTRE